MPASYHHRISMSYVMATELDDRYFIVEATNFFKTGVTCDDVISVISVMSSTAALI